MKNTLNFRKTLLLIMLLCTCSIIMCHSVKAEERVFSCYVTALIKGEEYRINSYYNDQDDNYYLFLPGGVGISSISVSISEESEICESTAGNLDTVSGVLSEAFLRSGDSVTLTNNVGNTYNLFVMQSNLPSVFISLPEETTIEDVHRDKEVKYDGTTVVVYNPVQEDNTNEEIIVDHKATFKGRGNSSWVYYEKKGYQIKFNKKQDVLGMGNAKKWILLANACDDSLMRNYLAFMLGKELGLVKSPDCAFVDLWINGEYRGNYLLTEKNEIDSERLNLVDSNAMLLEFDEYFYNQEEHWFDYNGLGHFVVKDTKTEDGLALNSMIDSFKNGLDSLFSIIINGKDNNEITIEDLRSFIDVESTID